MSNYILEVRTAAEKKVSNTKVDNDNLDFGTNFDNVDTIAN